VLELKLRQEANIKGVAHGARGIHVTYGVVGLKTPHQDHARRAQ
jgi:hypothetical protein